MSVFLDASALVAIIRDEPEAFTLREALAADVVRLTSGIAIWEAARALGREADADGDGLEEVQRYCAAFDILVIPIGASEAVAAVRVHDRYGKGRHPARLNLGDCFAYACAQANGARLLYKGDDFSKTDIGWKPV